VTAIKTAATVCSSESEDTDLSNGAGTSSHAGDSSPGSQSPPALERVERLADKDLTEDGVLIPPRPLAQWGVSFHWDQFDRQQQQLNSVECHFTVWHGYFRTWKTAPKKPLYLFLLLLVL